MKNATTSTECAEKKDQGANIDKIVVPNFWSMLRFFSFVMPPGEIAAAVATLSVGYFCFPDFFFVSLILAAADREKASTLDQA